MSDESPVEKPAEEPAPARDGEEEAAPIPDPLAGARAAESDVIALESFAARVGLLGKLSLGAGALALVLCLVAFTGRVDVGVLLYVAPVGALHAWLGVLLGRAAASLSDAAKARWSSREALVSSVRELHKVLGVLLISTGFLVFLLVVALLIAAAFQRATEI